MAVYMRTLASVRAYTAMCTCVHCHVYDGKSKEKYREVCGLQSVTRHFQRLQTERTNPLPLSLT